MATQWNDQEHAALRGLSMLAQLIYLKVFRKRMDFATGVAGGPGRMITYQTIVDECGFSPDPRSTKKRWTPTKGEARAAIEELERTRQDEHGDDFTLLSDRGSCKQFGYIKVVVLADTDQSVQNMNNARTTHEQRRTATHRGAQEIDRNSTDEKGNFEPRGTRSATQPENCCTAMNDTPPVSGIRKEKQSNPESLSGRASVARGARLTLTDCPPDWLAFAKQERPDLDPRRTWDEFRDYWIAVPGQKGMKADWPATWRNWCRRQDKRQYRGDSNDDRIANINREIMERGRRAAEAEFAEMGGCTVVPLRRDLA